jgi:hypothetical protein
MLTFAPRMGRVNAPYPSCHANVLMRSVSCTHLDAAPFTSRTKSATQCVALKPGQQVHVIRGSTDLKGGTGRIWRRRATGGIASLTTG